MDDIFPGYSCPLGTETHSENSKVSMWSDKYELQIR